MVTFMLDEGTDNLEQLEEHQRVEHIVIALYGLNPPSESMLAVFQTTLQWMAALGCDPTIFSSGNVTRPAGKYVPYPRGVKSFHANWRRASNFSVSCLPQGTTDRFRGEDSAAGYTPNGAFVMTFRATLLDQHKQDAITIARAFARLLEPRYGFISRLAFGFHPIEYGVGLSLNTGRSVQDWADAIRFDLYRFLRNVYPWSLLTDEHLDITVSGTRLEEWIREDSRRGSLTPFTDRMTLWTVDEAQIPALRQVLDAAGLFFDYERDLESRIQQFRCTEEEAAEHLRTGKPLVYRPRDQNEPPLRLEQVLYEVGANEPGATVMRVEDEGKLREVKGGKSPRKRGGAQ